MHRGTELVSIVPRGVALRRSSSVKATPLRGALSHSLLIAVGARWT